MAENYRKVDQLTMIDKLEEFVTPFCDNYEQNVVNYILEEGNMGLVNGLNEIVPYTNENNENIVFSFSLILVSTFTSFTRIRTII